MGVGYDSAYIYKEIVFDNGQLLLQDTVRLLFLQETVDDKMYATISILAPPFITHLQAKKMATTEIGIFDSPVSAFEQMAVSLGLI